MESENKKDTHIYKRKEEETFRMNIFGLESEDGKKHQRKSRKLSLLEHFVRVCNVSLCPCVFSWFACVLKWKRRLPVYKQVITDYC